MIIRVVLIDIRKASSPVASPRVRSRVRWGRRLAATAWKSSSGARATISTLKMKPAAAASTAARTKSAPELTRTCSREHHQQHRRGERAAAGEGELEPGLGRARRRRSGPRRWRAIANGSTVRLASGRDRDPERDRVDALGDPDRDRDREHQPRAALEHEQGRVEAELAPPGEEAAGVVGAAEAGEADDQHPVEDVAAVEQVLGDRPLEREQHDHREQRDGRPGSGPRSAARARCDSPTSSCSASVRESSCSIGRKSVAATTKFTDQRTTIVP